MRLTDVIEKVQSSMPDFLLLTVSSTEGTPDGEHFHVQINNIFVPLDYENPVKKINDLIYLLRSRVTYTPGDAYLRAPIEFEAEDFAKFAAEDLWEILNNIIETPVIMFISKNEWYVDVLGSGAFYPLRNVTASEFINYIQDRYLDGVVADAGESP